MRHPRRPKMKEPILAAKLLDAVLKGSGLDQKLPQYKALLIWDDVVGPQIAARTRPMRIRDNILEVNVDQAPWMQQLQLMKPKILKQLNDHLKPSGLKDLYLKRGKITPPRDVFPSKGSPWNFTELDEQEKKMLVDVLSKLQDQDLKHGISRFLEKQLKLSKARAETA